jgi:hypothetical protein
VIAAIFVASDPWSMVSVGSRFVSFPRSRVAQAGFKIMTVASPSPQGVSTIGWRTPMVIVLCGCLISMFRCRR